LGVVALSEILLKVHDLHVSYENIIALSGIDIQVKDGEIATIVGANGAGKSTSLMAISGIMRPKNGEIIFKERAIHNLKAHLICRMGVVQVPEGRQIFHAMTVMENLEMGAFTKSNSIDIRNDFESVFQHFPILKERLKQIAGTLSGGEQQMLAIGRAMMARPELLLMDEPSLGLAPIVMEKIFKIILKLNKSGITILLVEQNAHLALGISNQGYVMENGKIALSGKSSDLIGDENVRKAYLGG